MIIPDSHSSHLAQAPLQNWEKITVLDLANFCLIIPNQMGISEHGRSFMMVFPILPPRHTVTFKLHGKVYRILKHILIVRLLKVTLRGK